MWLLLLACFLLYSLADESNRDQEQVYIVNFYQIFPQMRNILECAIYSIIPLTMIHLKIIFKFHKPIISSHVAHDTCHRSLKRSLLREWLAEGLILLLEKYTI
ncbi:unnamed protein product [Musa textilis]